MVGSWFVSALRTSVAASCVVVCKCISFIFFIFIWVNRNTFYIIKLFSQVTLS